jgi:hypothetical protein
MHVRSPKEEGCQNWLMFSKFWTCYNKTQDPIEANTTQMNHVFANRSEEDEIYPLTVKEIVEAQQADTTLKHFFKCNSVCRQGERKRGAVPHRWWGEQQMDLDVNDATGSDK